jgi:hypothetical protein
MKSTTLNPKSTPKSKQLKSDKAVFSPRLTTAERINESGLF